MENVTPMMDWLQPTSCACAAVRRASRAVTQFYDIVLAPTGLKATQFAILRALAEYGEVPQWRLAKNYVIAVETLSRRLSGLRRKRFVELEVRGSRQEHVYRLTQAGKVALDNATPYWLRAQERLQRACGNDDWTRIIALCDQLTSAALKAESLKVSNVAAAAPGRLDRLGLTSYSPLPSAPCPSLPSDDFVASAESPGRTS